MIQTTEKTTGHPSPVSVENQAQEIRRLLGLPEGFKGTIALNFPGAKGLRVKARVEWWPEIP